MDVKGGMLGATRLVREVEKIPGYKLYGYPKWEYAYAVDLWPYGTPVPYDASKIKTAYLDIEVKSDEGFPEPTDARHPITAITIATKNKTIALGYKDYTGDRLKKNYIRCLDEDELLRKFIYVWKRLDFDIISGWNIRKFDIPYVMQRLERKWGKEPVYNEFLERMVTPKPVGAALSPWDRCSFYEMSENGRTYLIYKIPGVAIVDYLELYIKYGAKSRPESFKLDFIAGEELKERKLDYGDFKTLHEMYERDFNRFMDYNAHDAELVMKLESKRNLIGLVIDVAYMAKCQFEDVMHQTRLWDNMAYAKLLTKGRTVPALRPIVSNEGVDIAGAFVKPPFVGMHNWLCSLDVTSEYPSAMMQWNISPETLVTRQRLQEYRARVVKALGEMNT